MLIEFVIPGPPQGKARARTRVVKANDGRVYAVIVIAQGAVVGGPAWTRRNSPVTRFS